jgi:hypothetical protein
MHRPDFAHLEHLAAAAVARGETFSAVIAVDQGGDVAVLPGLRLPRAEPRKRGRKNRRGRAL